MKKLKNLFVFGTRPEVALGKLESKRHSDELNEVIFLKNNQNSSALIAEQISKCVPRLKGAKPKISVRYSFKKQFKAIAKIPLERKSFKKYVLGDRMKEWDNSYKKFDVTDVEKQLAELKITGLSARAIDKSRSIHLSKG